MNKPLLGVTLAAMLTSLAGCADSHQIARTNPNSTVRLSRDDVFFVAVPRDGAYGSKVYARSGEMTAGVIVGALARKGARADRADAYATLPASLDAARAAGATFLVYPTIIAWEDRATEWSGKSDVAEVRIEIVSVASGKVADSVIIKGKSGWATLGGDHPQDLLPKPIGDYFNALFN